MNIELKPCPFCGGQAELRVKMNEGVTVQCSKCDVQTRSWVDFGHGTNAVRTVVEAWNRRITDGENN